VRFRTEAPNEQAGQWKMVRQQFSDILGRLVDFNVPAGLTPHVEQHCMKAFHPSIIRDMCWMP
jgi:hypothetical protein